MVLNSQGFIVNHGSKNSRLVFSLSRSFPLPSILHPARKK